MEIKNTESGFKLKGEIFMKLGNNLSRQDVVNNPDRHMKNIIVDIASNLIASWAFMSNTGDPHPVTFGIKALAVGTGVGPEVPTQVLLNAELFRKTFSNVTYVDPILLTPTSNRTNIIDFTTTFLEAEAVGPLVEMGLFGGNYHLDNGTGPSATAANGGTQINFKQFLVINKPATAQLIIVYRLTF